jgi:outer membrane protein assembly factor BamB
MNLLNVFSATVPFCVAWITLSVHGPIAWAGDWPTFRGDAQRQGIGTEDINPALLRNLWTVRSDAPPHTAWAGPARWDAYARIPGLRSMRNYDAAFGVAVVGNSVFVASSSEDSVTCLKLDSGQLRWQFWADGPVRITPTVADGRLFFGSDDGFAYCLNADNGKLLWKFRPPANEPLVVHNGRMISRWPCRTGVLVKKGIAYCGFSLLPWDPSYLCALDVKTGGADGPKCFVRKMSSTTIEGAMAASNELLIAPQGRIPPMLFELAEGNPSGTLAGGGGSFVMVASDQTIYHGPGNKTGWVTVSDPKTGKAVETYKGFNASVLGDRLEYRLSDNRVTAFDRKSKATLWTTGVPNSHDLVLNGETVFVGGRDEVVALDANHGTQVWNGTVDGDAYLLVVAGGSLLVSTNAGVVHCFRPDAAITNQEPKPFQTKPKPKPIATAKIRAPKAPGLVGDWSFHSGMSARAKRRGLENAELRVLDLAGHLDGTILGPVNLRQAGGIEALVLDGSSNSVMLAEDHKAANLPQQQISVEAWVRVDKPLTWGGIVGAMQDNGNIEHGWILGYQGTKFSFAVKGTGGENKLTYLRGTTDFQSETWYHVVGTYDGTTQRIFVNGLLENTSTSQSGDIDYPPKAFYEIGAYHDQDENHKLTGMLHEVRVYSRALNTDEIRANQQNKLRDLPKPFLLASGPYARFLDRETAEVVWQTIDPSASDLIVDMGDQSRKVTDQRLKTDHRLRIDGLKDNRIYSYQLATSPTAVSSDFELDTTFNFTRQQVPNRPSPYHDDERGRITRRTAKRLLSESGVTAGICLVLGADDGRLVYELVRQSNLTVIGVETNLSKVATARTALTRAGIYGHRATIRQVESLDQLPYTGDFANLVVSDRMLGDEEMAGSSHEVLRILRPDGGLAWIGQTSGDTQLMDVDDLRAWCGSTQWKITDDAQGLWARIFRAPLEGAGEWSHLYGLANNSAFGGENLGGARSVKDLQVQWLGRPGPRAQADRNGRKPSPLATGGRLFVQGLHRLIGLDAYNGTILWSLEIPPMERFNVPRDSSNWCADEEHVFVAIQDACWQINAKTGQVESINAVQPGEHDSWTYDWSYIARHKNLLIGSAVKNDTAYVEFWGGADAGWYDARQGPVTFKVCSENIFACEKSPGRPRWTYSKGVILNSTITVADDSVFFVECRHPKVLASPSRRVGMPELWQQQFLVALDVTSGRVKWQRPLKLAAGIVTFYMSHGDGTLVIAASGGDQYDVYAFEDSRGEPIWQREIGWLDGKGDHGKAMSRPAIAGGRLFVRPQVLELQTGKVIGQMPGGGCGTYALTANTVIFRNGNVTLWDSEKGKSSSWSRLRPGCWLSTIPAGGMLLSPEAGGGCSCGKWLETSIGFLPKRQ